MNSTYQFYKAMLAFIQDITFSELQARKCCDLYKKHRFSYSFPKITLAGLKKWNVQLHHSQDEGRGDSSAFGKGIARRELLAKCAFANLAPHFRENEMVPLLFAQIKAEAGLEEDLFIYNCQLLNKTDHFEERSIIVDNPEIYEVFFLNPEKFFDDGRKVYFFGLGARRKKVS